MNTFMYIFYTISSRSKIKIFFFIRDGTDIKMAARYLIFNTLMVCRTPDIRLNIRSSRLDGLVSARPKFISQCSTLSLLALYSNNLQSTHTQHFADAPLMKKSFVLPPFTALLGHPVQNIVLLSLKNSSYKPYYF